MCLFAWRGARDCVESENFCVCARGGWIDRRFMATATAKPRHPEQFWRQWITVNMWTRCGCVLRTEGLQDRPFKSVRSVSEGDRPSGKRDTPVRPLRHRLGSPGQWADACTHAQVGPARPGRYRPCFDPPHRGLHRRLEQPSDPFVWDQRPGRHREEGHRPWSLTLTSRTEHQGSIRAGHQALPDRFFLPPGRRN
jgi:hypothetical protein